MVADEIRKLADDSKTTVVKIQHAAETVIEVVKNLVSEANTMLSFVENDVVRDYRAMLNVTQQYNRDADNINELATDLSATSQQVLASIQNMMKAINEVTHATNEGAGGTANIAEKSSDIANKAGLVSNSVNSVISSANTLNEMVAKFVI